MKPTPKTDTWIDINTFDVEIDEYKQLGYLHRAGEYKSAPDYTHAHFTFTKYVAAAAIGIDVPSNQDMVRVCYTFYPVDEDLDTAPECDHEGERQAEADAERQADAQAEMNAEACYGDDFDGGWY